MKKRYWIILIVLVLFLVVIIIGNINKKQSLSEEKISSEFKNSEKVNIIGYEGDAMEPFISRN